MKSFLPATPLLLLIHIPLCTSQLLAHDAPAPAPDPASSSSSPPSRTDFISLPSDTVRILVFGDSITQGQEGDFTWRYRLWEWFRSNHADALDATAAAAPPPSSSSSSTVRPHRPAPALRFVGPYNGTLPAAVGPAGVDPQHPQSWGSYHPSVDRAFSPGPGGEEGAGGNSAHLAVYGRPAWLAVDDEAAAARVAAHAPDLVVLHLGINDLVWWSRRPAEVAASVGALVAAARRARPGVRVLVADVSHRRRVPGRDDLPAATDAYNALLPGAVRAWATDESPVVLVRVSEEYACNLDSCPAGVDGLHPNALGEFQIARAYTKVLHEQFGLGSGPLAVPPLEDIPGMKPIGKFRINPMNVLLYPPVGVFMLVSFLSLALVVALRPRWMRAGRTAEEEYQPLPTTRAGMEGLM